MEKSLGVRVPSLAVQQTTNLAAIPANRLPILPSELPTTSRSLEAGSGKVFFKEDDLEVLRVRLLCPNNKVGNLFENSWQSVRDTSMAGHKEVKFAQNRASPLRARHRIIRGVVERRYYANMCSRGAVHAGVATFISVSAPGFSKKYLSLSSNKAFPTKLAFEKR